MFNVLAKRQLEKDVIRLVQEKGAGWCFQSQSVRSELLKAHPKQQDNIEALCQVILWNGFAYLMSVAEPLAAESQSRVVQRVIQQVGAEKKDAEWAVQCWASALSPIPHSQRMEIGTQLKAQHDEKRRAEAAEAERLRVASAERQRQAAIDAEMQQAMEVANKQRQRLALARQENQRIEQERQRIANERQQRQLAQEQAAAQAQSQADEKARAERRQYLIERWRLAFPKEFAAIQEAADSATKAQQQAETNPFRSRVRPEGQAAFRSRELIEEENELIREKIKQEGIISFENEILRRIETAPDQDALMKKLEQAWQIAGKRQRQIDEDAEKQNKLRELRSRFPLKCAGLTDDEIWNSRFQITD